MAMSILRSTMGMAIIETMKIKTTSPKYSVFSKVSKFPLPNSSVLTMSYMVRNTDAASRLDSQVVSASGCGHGRLRSSMNEFHVARMLMSITSINQRIAFTISTSMRTYGPDLSKACNISMSLASCSMSAQEYTLPVGKTKYPTIAETK